MLRQSCRLAAVRPEGSDCLAGYVAVNGNGCRVHVRDANFRAAISTEPAMDADWSLSSLTMIICRIILLFMYDLTLTPGMLMLSIWLKAVEGWSRAGRASK